LISRLHDGLIPVLDRSFKGGWEGGIDLYFIFWWLDRIWCQALFITHL